MQVQDKKRMDAILYMDGEEVKKHRDAENTAFSSVHHKSELFIHRKLVHVPGPCWKDYQRSAPVFVEI
jgi:hypothetical protein